MAKQEQGATEAPTSRRIERAWRAGDVRISAAAPAAAATAGGILVLMWIGAGALTRTILFMRESLGAAFDPAGVLHHGGRLQRVVQLASTWAASIFLPVAATAVVAAGLASLAQTRGRLTPLRPGRLGPRSGGPGITSKLPLVAAASLLLLVALVKVWSLRTAIVGVAFNSHAGALVAAAMACTAAVVASLLGLVVATAAFDGLWQWWLWRQSLKMTRRQVQEESRAHEGDPRHRGERHRLGREEVDGASTRR